jgi:fructose/tagatose bisphosphate aldolase
MTLAVEAELGEIGGKNGVHAAGARTEPSEAQAFVEATGVDALGVAVGTSHAMIERRAALDIELIGALRLRCRCHWCYTSPPEFPTRSWFEQLRLA